MVDRIALTVPHLRLSDVLEIAGTSVPGRPHLADALVCCGAVPNRAAAFAAYLLPGCATYLETWSPPIEDTIRVVTAAGGATVVAHPWGRGSVMSAERFGELAEAGLDGIEVDHQQHDAEARSELRRIAGTLGLVVTGSSDYHGNAQAGPRPRVQHDCPGRARAATRLLAATPSAGHDRRGSGVELEHEVSTFVVVLDPG